MCRQTVCVVGDGNQTGPSTKDGNTTAGVVDRHAQKAVLRPLCRKSLRQKAFKLLPGRCITRVKTQVARVLGHAALPQAKAPDLGKSGK